MISEAERDYRRFLANERQKERANESVPIKTEETRDEPKKLLTTNKPPKPKTNRPPKTPKNPKPERSPSTPKKRARKVHSEIQGYCLHCDAAMYVVGLLCNPICSGRYRAKQNQIKSKNKPRKPGGGRKKSTERKCKRCKKTFTINSGNPDQKYCDRNCSNQSNREKIVDNITAKGK